jgi:mono/diheme cytochrome c family protein
VAGVVGLALVALLALGCRQDMHDQPRYKPLRASAFFADGMASRQPVGGTVARGQLREGVRYFTGRDENEAFVTALPVALDRPLLLRGRERYDAFCAPCHGRLGDGDGMVVLRGFRRPPSLLQPRVQEQPIGYYYDVVTAGFGVMPAYAAQIPPRDRWAIAAYLRALQLSQGAPVAELTPDERARLPATPGGIPTEPEVPPDDGPAVSEQEPEAPLTRQQESASPAP